MVILFLMYLFRDIRDSFVVNAYCSIDLSRFYMSFIVTLSDGEQLVRTRHNLMATASCIKPSQLTKKTTTKKSVEELVC